VEPLVPAPGVDVLALLRRQSAITVEGIEHVARWAGGEAGAASAVEDAEHRADAAKWELLNGLRATLVTPLEPEDLFALSRALDWLVDYAKDAISESEVMACPPDQPLGEMAALLAEAVRRIDSALARLGGQGDAAAAAAGAIRAQRELEAAYRTAMAALLDLDDLREVTARRELYRRCARIGEIAVDAAERVIYAVVKES
jgi:uncharacterized protein Yka (UPF0111/DUF47 family)